jgi:hypothetical protein
MRRAVGQPFVSAKEKTRQLSLPGFKSTAGRGWRGEIKEISNPGERRLFRVSEYLFA